MDKKYKALNEKLLKFAGFERFTQAQWDISLYVGCQYCKAPDGTIYTASTAPDLVNDANAQIKWLYAKLLKEFIVIRKVYEPALSQCEVDLEVSMDEVHIAYNKSETLAFALAVEKYIDSLEKK